MSAGLEIWTPEEYHARVLTAVNCAGSTMEERHRTHGYVVGQSFRLLEALGYGDGIKEFLDWMDRVES